MDRIILHIEDLRKDDMKSFLADLIDLLGDYAISGNGVFIRNYDLETQIGDRSIKIINSDLFTGNGGDDSPYARINLEVFA